MIKNRSVKYLVLLIGSVLVPFLTTIVIIILSGSRNVGMKSFLFPSAILIHLFFSLTQMTGKVLKKIIFGTIAAIISSAVATIPIYFDIRLNLDMYGFWDLIIYFSLGAVGTWECLYQFDIKINKDTIIHRR